MKWKEEGAELGARDMAVEGQRTRIVRLKGGWRLRS